MDAAFERRFAKIAMEPDPILLNGFLNESGMEESLRDRVLKFFNWINGKKDSYGSVGHTYFIDASNESDLKRLWDHQLRFHFERAYILDAAGLQEVNRRWQGIFEDKPSQKSVSDAVVTIGDSDDETDEVGAATSST